MNIDRLLEAEAEFLQRYPGGFEDPALVEVGKRHRVPRMTEFCQEHFGKSAFRNVAGIMEAMTKAVSRASMVSMFEKPKFRDFVKGLNTDDRATLADALKRQLHGTGSSPQKGFETMVELLAEERIAKWSLVTILPNYYHPDTEVFVKPTTAKGVIKTFELEGLKYNARPSWEFYDEYRRQILGMRKMVSPKLAPNNAAFCGFLMITSGANQQR